MNRRNLTVILFLGVIALSFSVFAYAGTEVKDMIRMENKAYAKHKKSVMDFSHKKHTEDYKAGCGECHHDKDNKPLNDLKIGDDVQNCIECHKKASMIKGKEAKGLTDAQKREHHANAIHDNCKECHKKFNKEKGLDKKDPKAAPVTCKQCHPKKEK